MVPRQHQGDRVPYYSVDTLGFTKECAIHVAQPGRKGHCIFDADYEEDIRRFNQTICRNPIWSEMAAEGVDFDCLPEAICEHDWRIGTQQALVGGRPVHVDTFEEANWPEGEGRPKAA